MSFTIEKVCAGTIIVTCCVILSGCHSPLPTLSTTVFVEGAPLRGAFGIMFDSEDRLYVAGVGEIAVVDVDSGQVLERIGQETGSAVGDDVAIGPDGAIYWTEFFGGDVARFTPDDGVTKQFLGVGVNPITFTNDGRLFVARDFLGDGLYEVDPFLQKAPRLVVTDFGGMNAMDWGPDGFLYGPLRSKGQIVSVDVETGKMNVVADPRGTPYVVKFDSEGNLFFAMQWDGERQIHRLRADSGTTELVVGVDETYGLDNFDFDSRGRLFASRGSGSGIFEVLIDGAIREVLPGGLMVPGGVAVLSGSEGESVFIADFMRVREFDAATGAERPVHNVLGNTVSAHKGLLVLTNWFTNELLVWNPMVRMVEERVTNLATPLNAVRFREYWAVAELGSGPGKATVSLLKGDERVVILDASSGIGVPIGLAVKDGDLFVADWAHGTLVQAMRGGERMSPPRVLARGLQRPEGLAVAPGNRLLVVESGAKRISSVAIDSGARTTLVDNLELGMETVSGVPPTYIFNGLAVSESGLIYVAGDRGNVVYRIEEGT